MSFLTSFLSFLLLYKYWALVVLVFAGALALPLPGNTILLAAGAFASQGVLDVWAVLGLAIGANVAADGLGFFLGYIFEEKIFRFLRWKGASAFAKIESKVRAYAAGTIFFTRIAGPFAPYVNLLAGFLEVPYRKFLLYDFLGNATGAAIFIFAGYLLGNYWQSAAGDIWLLAVFVVVLLLIYIVFQSVKAKRSRKSHEKNP